MKVYLYRRIVQAKLFIDDNYFQKIDLDNIADEAYFSKFHFIRLFKSIYKMTPHQYLIAVRIKNSMKLLRSGLSVSDACCLVGFESLSSFSVLFKKMNGCNPSNYLEMQSELKRKMINEPLRFIPGCHSMI